MYNVAQEDANMRHTEASTELMEARTKLLDTISLAIGEGMLLALILVINYLAKSY